VGVGDDDDDSGAMEVSIEHEMARFKSVPASAIKAARDINGKYILLFWAQNKMVYPVHYVMASKFLAALCTEANVERKFSFAGRTMSDRRTSMSPLLFGALMRIAHNFKHLGEIDWGEVRRIYDGMKGDTSGVCSDDEEDEAKVADEEDTAEA
jgi:hypothetical protein